MEQILNLQRRFFRKEKDQYLDAIEEKLTEYGYEFERKSFEGIVKSVNLETKCNNPAFIFMAHYDTGTKIPFWGSFYQKFFGNNNILPFIAVIYIILLGVPMLINWFANPLTFEISNTTYTYHPSYLGYLTNQILIAIFCISLLVLLFPNKKNLNDNTSGVISLLLLAKKLKENGIDNVKFIFMDNEEKGLFGSRSHKKYFQKENLIPQNCKIMSIDCVGGEEDVLLLARNGESDYVEFFYEGLKNDFELCKSIKTFVPFSDNYSFRKYGALNISFCRNAMLPGGYGLPNVHSAKDDKIDIDKIEKLTNTLKDIVIKSKNK